MNGITPRPGGSGSDEEFVGRDETTRWAIRQWRRGQDLILSDPRRMGKTAWLQALPSLGIQLPVVNIDYEGIDSTDAFLIRTVEALSENSALGPALRGKLSAYFDGLNGEISGFGIRLKAGVVAAPRTRLITSIIDSLETRPDKNGPVVIAMDEITAAIINISRNESPDRARVLLETLRGLRARTRHVRWILCGSVGMHHALRIAQSTSGVVNDLQTVPFGPLDPSASGELARRLMVGIHATADNETIDQLVNETDGVPYFLHAVMALLETTHTSQHITPGDVSDAMSRYIRSRDDSQATTHLLNRIDTYYDHMTEVAYAFLDAAAVATRAEMPDRIGPDIASSELNRLIDLLVDDHYLIEDAEGRVSWRYPLLRRIWTARRRLR